MTSFFYAKWLSFLGMLFCFGLLAFAAYLQLHLGLLPCPLCVLQRILLLWIGFVFLVGALYTPSERFGQRVHTLFLMIPSLLGLLVSGRHVWLTLQPPSDMTACSPTLGYMLANLPLTQTLKVLFLGSGDCAKVTWRFLSLSLPEWTLICFAGFFIFTVLRYMFAKNQPGL